LTKHPTKAALEAFLLGKLARPERNDVVAHLVRGCARCRRALAPLGEALFATPPLTVPDGGWRYELAVRRAIRRALSGERSAADGGLPEAGRLLQMPQPGWSRAPEQLARCAAALAETRALARSDPQAMLALAIANSTVAEHLDPAAFAPGAVYDLQARAHAELGNARRILSDFPNAAVEFRIAVERARAGTTAPLLVADILWMAASLYRATRKFDQAFRLLDRAHAVYCRLGEQHLAGRTLISKGVAKAAHGNLSEASQLLLAGVRLVDGEREPALLLAGVHNLIWARVEKAQFTQGRALIQTHHELYRRYGSRFDLLRLRWLEGRIAAGLNEPGEAEAALLEARSGFAEHRLAYSEALVSLDLMILLQREGRKNEVGALVEEMLSTFRRLGIRREELAVHLVTRRKSPPSRLTPALLRSADARLRRRDKWGR
jgi:tetratricopeptide (TPR) repeat protein